MLFKTNASIKLLVIQTILLTAATEFYTFPFLFSFFSLRNSRKEDQSVKSDFSSAIIDYLLVISLIFQCFSFLLLFLIVFNHFENSHCIAASTIEFRPWRWVTLTSSGEAHSPMNHPWIKCNLNRLLLLDLCYPVTYK